MGTPQTREELQAEIERLKKLNSELAAEERGQFGMKLGTGGNVVLQGMGGKYNTLNLYPAQVDKIAAHIDDIQVFVKANAKELEKRAAIAKAARASAKSK